MKRIIALSLLLHACGTNEPETTTEDDMFPAACWYEDGSPTLHKYYPEGYIHDEDFERACNNLGKPVNK